MERKSVKYIRTLVNRKKEVKKGFLGQYKGNIDTISSLCTITTFAIATITILTQFWNSYQAAQFYNIDKTYFFQESVWNMIFETTKLVMIKVFGLFFPMAVFHGMLFYKKDIKKPTSMNQGKYTNAKHRAWFTDLEYIINNHFVPSMLCFSAFFIYVLFSVAFISSNERKILAQLPVWVLPLYFYILFLVLYFIGINDDGHKIRSPHRIRYEILAGICYLVCVYYSYVLTKDTGKLDWEAFMRSFFATYFIFIQCIPEDKGNKGLVVFGTILLFVAFMILVVGPYCTLLYNFLENPYTKKQDYEIVQKMSSSNLEEQVRQKKLYCDYPEEQKFTRESFQVVILHHGSQVLLMNGEIDGNQAINPQEDLSSSNLVIDTSSYEFQEASQYRFYRKEFKDVTTEFLKEQENKKKQESP